MPHRGSSRGTPARGHGSGRATKAAPRRDGIGDGAVYFLFVFLGLVFSFFAWLIAGGSAVPWIVGYTLAILWLLNMAVVSAYRGGTMKPWQKSLARIPLRPAGYGARGGKPIEAAHGEPQVRSAMIATACVSLAIAGLGLALMAQVL